MKLYLTIVTTCLYLTTFAQADEALRRRNYNLDNGVALKEFDPVSYFKGKAARGNSKLTYDYKRVTYYFASEANREEFKKSPAKYEPAYGGWCAHGMAESKKLKVDPSTYKIINGKLYLFYNFNNQSSLVRWNLNEKKLKAAADKNWARMNR